MPYVAVVGMKDMGAVFVNADSVFVIIVIRVAADMFLAVNNRHFLVQFFSQFTSEAPLKPQPTIKFCIFLPILFFLLTIKCSMRYARPIFRSKRFAKAEFLPWPVAGKSTAELL